ncbi:unnamed protein product [Acanthoscelides obtectus]|uniref:Uncharacterized protein n=1 Tax=Acanthoscelides obtectus TaxID=200917 RepID=A0A9P0L7N7_ACAOB|nr:unnamed protein product [Acanthoscelides obtectus]CAK1649104.1 hypothetical protein AOBTE_LOCUS16044 [Acanthoscelides obtectus]
MLNEKEEEGDRPYIRQLGDAGRLLADLFHQETVSRRELAVLNINKDLRDILLDSPVDDWLFGRDLEDKVKQSKSLVQIKPPSIIATRSTHGREAVSTALPDQLWRKTAVPKSSRKEASTAGPTRAEREISPMNTEVGETAGRLKLFYANWYKITSDKHVLSWIKGVRIPFFKKPRQSHIPKEPKWSPTELCEIENNIKKCLSTGALKKVRPVKDQFLSNIFVTPKPDGSQRLILNLKSLNDYISVSHFKLEEHKIVNACFPIDVFILLVNVLPSTLARAALMEGVAMTLLTPP